MIAKTLEPSQSSPSRSNRYTRTILLLLAAVLAMKTVWFWDLGGALHPREIVDFDTFYIVAEMVWRGEIEQAYSFATMSQAQEAFGGKQSFMPWTYPPQFNLLVAPLAFLPLGLAYSCFTAGTLVAYLVILKRIAGDHFQRLLLVLFPAIIVTVACGQNGFLTGTLIGLTCLGFQRHKALAGLPLGLMIIKPHLAVTFAVYTLIARRWITALVAAGTVAATSLLATLLLGPGIWAAFLDGVKEARVFLEHGMYPLYRMISVYAALYTVGVPAPIAITVQVLVAIVALMMIGFASRRGLGLRQSLGLAAVASLLISPYAYDYDLPIYGIGLALLLPDLERLGSKVELTAIYVMSVLIGLVGLAQSFRLQVQFGPDVTLGDDMPVSVAGPALVVLLALMWRILGRHRESLPAT
ncbi:glycosyltransferase family 87 protein [Microvirga aerophila]|nr:glycosyltransferase family 87 protein [Microvirga aerophila]